MGDAALLELHVLHYKWWNVTYYNRQNQPYGEGKHKSTYESEALICYSQDDYSETKNSYKHDIS